MFWTNFFDGDPPPSGDIKKLFGVVLLFIRYEGNCWLFLGRSLNAGHAGGGPLGGVFPWLFLPSGIVDGAPAPAPDTSLLDIVGRQRGTGLDIAMCTTIFSFARIASCSLMIKLNDPTTKYQLEAEKDTKQ